MWAMQRKQITIILNLIESDSGFVQHRHKRTRKYSTFCVMKVMYLYKSFEIRYQFFDVEIRSLYN
jgi:hypothetical protein